MLMEEELSIVVETNNNKKTHKLWMVVACLLVIAIVTAVIVGTKSNADVRSVRSDVELLDIYNKYDYYGGRSNRASFGMYLLTMPFSLLFNNMTRGPIYNGGVDFGFDDYVTNSATVDSMSPQTSSVDSGKDFSTTNLQVESVDEADVLKTDGDYIYSISADNVVITNVEDPVNPKKTNTISISEGYPEDLILSQDKLIVISGVSNGSFGTKDTLVKIYDINDKQHPELIKSFRLHAPYYTSRRIDDKLYVFASGYLRKSGDKVDRSYQEDNQAKEIALSDIKYLRDVKTRSQTLLSSIDLNEVESGISVSSYLMNISNAYVSANNVYLVDEDYSSCYRNDAVIPPIFGIKGVFGVSDMYDYTCDSSNQTNIYKFEINPDGTLKYSTKGDTTGTIINQFSLDEYGGNLRVAIQDSLRGSRVVVFDESMKQVGASDYMASGERMYSSRFVGDRAYLVTYMNTDPLFVIDVADPNYPKVLGELKIPGYSTYLHPFDDSHLIGIGMDSDEQVTRDLDGRVISTRAVITGMKMALFDVSDVNNPTELSKTTIGDRHTTSAILTNHKALLFSREKQLLAIPINNFAEDFEIKSSDNLSTMVDDWTKYNQNFIAEGYAVYNLNLIDGFDLRGIVTHDAPVSSRYENGRFTRLLRGIYIDKNLFTVSESMIKVNNLNDLTLVGQLVLKGEE